MEFNILYKQILETFNIRNNKARRKRNYGTQNSVFNQKQNIGSTGGFKGSKDSKMIDMVFSLPRRPDKVGKKR